jgi:hypothetical protein
MLGLHRRQVPEFGVEYSIGAAANARHLMVS